MDPNSPQEKTLDIKKLLDSNKEWAAQLERDRPGFFASLANQQSPELLWIGCSDSRVPANQLLQLLPGEVFVHRNIANIVHGSDLNAHSVLQFAVDVLKVKHIIVCGHYNCGGVRGALSNQQFGLVDHWIRSIKDLASFHEKTLKSMEPQERFDRMVELNVQRSVEEVANSTTVQNAWKRGQKLEVHGWCYRVEDGIIKDLGLHKKGIEDLEGIYRVV
ncbi:hypothetical protein HK104_003362 [Borealophlyctis nickersoniae]|nr:hypothetical protein HK104_003362 [Borealophlyctis nickersoniae]